MSTTYTPTSNWSNRDLKGRDLQARPLRPSEPVSFGSDPATDRLSRRMSDDVRPVRDEPAVEALADDDFMNRPMVNASDDSAVRDGPDIFEAPMVNTVSQDAASDSSVLDAPMADAAPSRIARREPGLVDGEPAVAASRSEAALRNDVITPAYGEAPRRRGLSPMVMIGAPLGVAAVAAIGWLALSGNETAAPPAEATQPLEIAAAAPAADPLINMPVSETGAPMASACSRRLGSSQPTPPPVRAAPARTEPVRTEPAVVAQTVPETATTAPVEPAAPAISPEPVSASEPVVEAPAPLIATEPLSPQ